MENKELHLTIKLHESAQSIDPVEQIVFHFKDGQTSCIKKEELIKLLLDTSVIALQGQEHKTLVEEFGEFWENIKDTAEYKFAMEVENALNNMCFNNRNFVESIPFFHRTLQQNLFRLFKDSFLYMSGLDARRYVDARNESAFELSQKIAKTLDESHLPFI